MPEIVWRYERSTGELSSGELAVLDGEITLKSVQFSNAPFLQMLQLLNGLLHENDVSSVRVSRRKVSYAVGAELQALIKKDPEEALKAMTFERTVIVRDQPSVSINKPTLRIGADTIADSFGEYVYLTAHDGKVECPFCGRWTLVTAPVTVCAKCRGDCQRAFIVSVEGKWGKISTMSLLHTPSDKYFLPRSWNKTAPWITRGALQDMFNQWKELENKQ